MPLLQKEPEPQNLPESKSSNAQIQIEAKFFNVRSKDWDELGSRFGSSTSSAWIQRSVQHGMDANAPVSTILAPSPQILMNQQVVQSLLDAFNQRDPNQMLSRSEAITTGPVKFGINIKPEIINDGNAIQLVLLPEITSFEGFKEEHKSVQTKNGGESIFTNKVPVFISQTLQTTVTLYEGQTLLLGGLEASKANVDDKHDCIILLTARVLPEKEYGMILTADPDPLKNVESPDPSLSVVDLFRIAEDDFKNERFEKAETGFKQILRIDPYSATAYKRLREVQLAKYKKLNSDLKDKTSTETIINVEGEIKRKIER